MKKCSHISKPSYIMIPGNSSMSWHWHLKRRTLMQRKSKLTVFQGNMKGEICCGDHLVVAYGDKLFYMYLQIFSKLSPPSSFVKTETLQITLEIMENTFNHDMYHFHTKIDRKMGFHEISFHGQQVLFLSMEKFPERQNNISCSSWQTHKTT